MEPFSRVLAMPSARRRNGFRALGARSTFFRRGRTGIAPWLEQSARHARATCPLARARAGGALGDRDLPKLKTRSFAGRCLWCMTIVQGYTSSALRRDPTARNPGQHARATVLRLRLRTLVALGVLAVVTTALGRSFGLHSALFVGSELALLTS